MVSVFSPECYLGVSLSLGFLDLNVLLCVSVRSATRFPSRGPSSRLDTADSYFTPLLVDSNPYDPVET